MTLDKEHDAADQAIRDALEKLRSALIELGHSSYVDVVDHLQWALSHDRRAFYIGANGGAVWRNMGSIADFGERPILEALVKLAEVMDAAHLAAPDPTLADAQNFKELLARGII